MGFCYYCCCCCLFTGCKCCKKRYTLKEIDQDRGKMAIVCRALIVKVHGLEKHVPRGKIIGDKLSFKYFGYFIRDFRKQFRIGSKDVVPKLEKHNMKDPTAFIAYMDRIYYLFNKHDPMNTGTLPLDSVINLVAEIVHDLLKRREKKLLLPGPGTRI